MLRKTSQEIKDIVLAWGTRIEALCPHSEDGTQGIAGYTDYDAGGGFFGLHIAFITLDCLERFNNTFDALPANSEIKTLFNNLPIRKTALHKTRPSFDIPPRPSGPPVLRIV
jgi:hypothetical protein